MHKLLRSKKDHVATNVPLAVAVTPFASRRHPSEPRVPEINFAEENEGDGDFGPPRCSRCLAYINRFVSTWGKQKLKNHLEAVVWTCPLCEAKSQLPEWYVDSGVVRESASIDFELASGYRVRPVQKPLVVFVVDASFDDLGFLAERIKESCPTGQGESVCCRYGLVFFNKSSIYFVSSAKEDSDSNLVAVTDIDDPFCPLAPNEWLFEAGRMHCLLQMLPQLVAATADVVDDENVCVAALAAAADGLETVGGKVCLMTSSSPTRGLGSDFASTKAKVKASKDIPNSLGSVPANFFVAGEREDAQSTRHGRSRPRTLEELSQRLSLRQIGVSIICVEGAVSKASRLDGRVATLGRLCEATGGRFYYHPSVRGDAAFSANLRRATSWLSYQSRGERELTLGSAHECVLKVRCSRGLRVARYYGAGIGGDVVEVLDETNATRNIVCCDATQTIMCDLEYDDGYKIENEFAYVQAALLYSDALTGRRLVRVHTLELSYSNDIQAVFKSLDTETVFTALTKRAQVEAGAGGHDPLFLSRAFGGRSQYKGDSDGKVAAKRWTTARDGVVDACVLINQSYRTLCVANAGENSGQLILPESIKLLPLLCLGALKGLLLREKDEPEEGTISAPLVDAQTIEIAAAQRSVNVSLERAALLSRSLGTPTEEIVALAYPRLYELPRTAEEIIIKTLPTSSENISSDRAYILDAGHVIYLYIGDDVDDLRREELLTILFDTDRPDWLLGEDIATFYDVSTQENKIAAQYPETISEVDHVRTLVAMMCEYRSVCPQLRLISGQKSLRIFWNHLIEDQTDFGASYTDFLRSIHKEIKNRMQPVDRSYM